MSIAKKVKPIVAFVLVVVTIMSFSVTAFADYLETQFANFQYIEQGHSSSYVRVLQRFLLNFNSTTSNFISSNGGVDGSFGLGTHYAAYEFQKAYFSNDASQWDGKIGSNSWKAIYHSMSFVDNSGEGTIYYFYRGGNLILWKLSGTWYVKDKYNITYSFT